MVRPNDKVPVTMLSGFLGTGKTSLLRYLLQNTQGVKVACIVNDVASVNIDAKLVRNDKQRVQGEGINSTKDLADTVELQNGCACCTLQDELLTSFESVLRLADERGEPYSRIFLENSGVAEPSAIRDNFNEAHCEGHPVMDRIYLDTLVTLVDASTFVKDFASKVPVAARPDLGDGGNLRPVVDLLVEQIECADILVLNKTDLMTAVGPAPECAPVPAPPALLAELVALMSSLNPLATVVSCCQGRAPLDLLFGARGGAVVAQLNMESHHRSAVAAATVMHKEQQAHVKAKTHGHHHHHDHDDNSPATTDTMETDEDHDHEPAGHVDHAHDEHHGHGDHTHHAGHAHGDHDHAHAKHDHGSHGHSPNHDHSPSHDCTHADHTHDHHAHAKHDHGTHDHAHHHHDHDHDHAHHNHDHGVRPATRAAQRFGITSFVYRRRRPFHTERLREMVLRWLPVATNTAIGSESPQQGDAPIKKVLRSKGFMWLSNSHRTAFFWSHAGQSFEIKDEGDWWSAVPESDWPRDAAGRGVVLGDFEGPLGDRRQEIVFIGVGMDEDKISAQLDGALVTDDELLRYTTHWSAHSPDPHHPAVVVTLSNSSGPTTLDHHMHAVHA